MPDLTITCDGCKKPVTFKDLAELMKRRGFHDDTCDARHIRRGHEDKAPRKGSWNKVDAARIAVRGPRPDLRGVSFRSAMEANCARFFDFTGITWTFEPKMFVFSGEERAPVNYRPDFRVEDRGTDWWVEVKGRWTPHDRQKLRKLARYHPRAFAELWVICRWAKGARGREEQRLLRGISPHIRITDYKAIQQLRGVLPGWEGK